ncbi:MAG TPA: acyclic terpene utilization AtuA family protein, partial [Gemmatimonadaceae bacterium]
MSKTERSSRVVRVASGQGFWGDWLEAPRRQVDGGDVDYLMLDYLAEVTMSILQKQKERDPKMGYARDFIGAIESVLPAIASRGVRVIANAGGVNPPACAAAVRQVAVKRGVSGDVRIGVVTGDDLLPRIDQLAAAGHALANMETGEPLSSVRDRVLSANAYIGSTPIVEALGQGANIVITGRSTDTALTMAPLRYEFAWKDDDWDRLAAGIVAGHTIECGAQCSGGNCLADWQTIPDLANVGYPIVEGHEDGSFVIYKHPNTGGRISVPSVTEQLVYEMGDPHSYITPDVIADFTSIHLEAAGENRVRLFGIKGRPPTDKLKVSIAYRAGFKAVGTLVYSWPDAQAKAELADRVLRERLDRLGLR